MRHMTLFYLFLQQESGSGGECRAAGDAKAACGSAIRRMLAWEACGQVRPESLRIERRKLAVKNRRIISISWLI
jgi:hypothetical protein